MLPPRGAERHVIHSEGIGVSAGPPRRHAFQKCPAAWADRSLGGRIKEGAIQRGLQKSCL
eukprot:8845832-Pyramimonas_sp.AAC.1